MKEYDMIRAVTANLGCASPSAVGGERIEAAGRWAQEQRDAGVDLVFAQEVPRGWLEKWVDAYDVAAIQGPSYRVRSALLWRKEAIVGTPFTLPTASYHGSYVASARLSLPGFDQPIVALSVHASPLSSPSRTCRRGKGSRETFRSPARVLAATRGSYSTPTCCSPR